MVKSGIAKSKTKVKFKTYSLKLHRKYFKSVMKRFIEDDCPLKVAKKYQAGDLKLLVQLRKCIMSGVLCLFERTVMHERDI